MNNIIEKNENGYVLNSADGVRIITRDAESHRLIGILTTAPSVGQMVIRNLTDTETAEYVRIRKSERTAAKIAKKAAEDKTRKAEEKKAKREAYYARCAERKAANRELQAETELFTAVKKLENAKQKPEETKTVVKSVDPRDDLKETLRMAKAFLTAAKGTDCEVDAQNAVDAAYAELAKYDAEHQVEKAEKPAVKPAEPIGKPPYADTVENKQKEVAPMKDVTNTKRLLEVLKQAKIPQKTRDELVSKFTVTDLRPIVFAEAKDALMEIDGIGEKRAETIIKALTGRIPEPLAMKKLSVEVREQLKAEIREKAKGYSLRSYEPDELWREVWSAAEELRKYHPEKDEDPLKVLPYRESLERIKAQVLADAPLTVRAKEGRIIRLNRSAISDILGIDYAGRRPTNKLIVVNRGIQEVFDFHWKLFSNDEQEGEKIKDEFLQNITKRMCWRGIVTVNKAGQKMFGIIGSSAGHQKDGKALFADANVMKAHEKLLWFGRTMEEFVNEFDTTGAEWLKARANLLRPWMKPFMLKSGKKISILTDVLVVKDVKKLYKVLNARYFGKDTGKQFTDGTFDEPIILGDGAMLAIKDIQFQGQGSSMLFKGFVADATSSVEELCRKHGISIEDVMNTIVEGIDGKMHRLGDFAIICGEGCWKGDKVFHSYTEYLGWISEMSKIYPDIDKLYLLRQAEEIEDEEKVRRLTKSLIQQWLFMSLKERVKLTKKARKQLKKAKTMAGAVSKLAALWKTEEERTAVERLFEKCPWLIMSPVIQNYLSESWKKKQIEAASGKFKTTGQYPYIMQDPVALLEVWVLGMSPDDPSLGILKDGEVSVADVPDGRKVLCVRFPANYLTAQVRKVRACKEAFGSLNGVMVLSVHDLILIIQDGDVDGDEMCVIYDHLAIKLTERMNNKFKPPVVLFAHGGKPQRIVKGSKKAFMNDVAVALWRAQRYNSVGIYANMATKCAYLAAIAYKNGNDTEMTKWLNYMSAASTGAILAIDQVKGNAVDEGLIRWLEQINEDITKALRKIARQMGVNDKMAYKVRHPFVQWYTAAAKRKPILWENCLPANEDNFLDQISMLILKDTGVWEFDGEGTVWSKEGASEVLLNHSVPQITVPYATITEEMVELLGDNWFKLRGKTQEERAIDKTTDTLKKLHVGSLIGLKEFILLLWRNECSMCYTMDGRTLWEKKEEYREVCKTLLRMLLKNGDWSAKAKYANSVADDHVFSDEERWQILVNAIIKDAFELNKDKTGKYLDNNVENKGSYAMFCLSIVAEDVLERGLLDEYDLFGVNFDISVLMDEIEKEEVEDEEQLFESAPAQSEDQEDEIPDEVWQEIINSIPPEEDDGWIPPMEEGWIPEEEC